MTSYNSHKTKIIYVDESAFGDITGKTFNSDGTVMNKVQAFSPDAENSMIFSKGIGEGRDFTETNYGNFMARCSITYNPTNFDFLKFAIGPKSGAGSTASHYELTEADDISYAGSGIETFSMAVSEETGTTDDVDVWSGCIINDFSVTGTIGGLLSCSVNVFAKTVVHETTAYTTTFTSERPFVCNNITLAWGTGTPSTVAKVQNFSVDFSNNVIDIRQLGDRFTADYDLGDRTYNFTITAIWNSALVGSAGLLHDDWLGTGTGSPSTAAIPPSSRLMNLTISEGSSSGDKNAIIYLTDCAINRATKPVNVGEGRIEVTYTGQARTGGNTNKPIAYWTTT